MKRSFFSCQVSQGNCSYDKRDSVSSPHALCTDVQGPLFIINSPLKIRVCYFATEMVAVNAPVGLSLLCCRQRHRVCVCGYVLWCRIDDSESWLRIMVPPFACRKQEKLVWVRGDNDARNALISWIKKYELCHRNQFAATSVHRSFPSVPLQAEMKGQKMELLFQFWRN